MSQARRINAATTKTMSKERSNVSAPKQRLTHFLCIPLGHHAGLRDSWTRISSALLAASPPIPGLHTSIIVPPRSLHLTLGVLSLAEDKKQTENSPRIESDAGSLHTPQAVQQHKVSDALRLLHSLRDQIDALLHDSPTLAVSLERLNVMNTDPARAHVLWAGPDVTTATGGRFKDLCDLVHAAFREAGMLQDAVRPLKLHCTLMNTIYRKPRGKGGATRVPFSCTAMRESDAYSLIQGTGDECEERPWRIDMGSWPVEEVQLCEMGRGEDGVYHSVGAISLYPALSS